MKTYYPKIMHRRGLFQFIFTEVQNSLRSRIFVPMKSPINLFSELGNRLSLFGEDTVSRSIIVRAQEANVWFTPAAIRRAVAALCSEMLRRDHLEAWLGAYDLTATQPRRVLIVMAGSIPLVGFFDLLCVICAGHHCVVKPSGKDLVLLEYIVNLLREIEPYVPISFYDGHEPVDAVIATGSDNATRYFKARFSDIPLLLRGSRQSVAVLSGRESELQLRGLTDDVFAYSGLGCRNVSLIFIPRGHTLRLTPPTMNAKYYNNYLQTKALMAMQGISFFDLGTAVLTEQWAFPTALSHINYAFYDTPEEVSAWLTEHDDELQCVVTEHLAHSRRVDFGRAQSPTLTDYPDDRDVMDFLSKI